MISVCCAVVRMPPVLLLPTLLGLQTPGQTPDTYLTLLITQGLSPMPYPCLHNPTPTKTIGMSTPNQMCLGILESFTGDIIAA